MTEEIKMKMEEGGLGKFADGYIGFNIKAKDTEENREIHNTFRLFCQKNEGNNYTKGIGTLLELSQFDFKYEMLYNEIHRLNVEVLQLKAEMEYLAAKDEKKAEPKEDGKKAF